MRKVLGLLLAVACVIPLSAQAGTESNPEVLDAAGDAFYPGVHGTNADWADITRVWFETTRTDGAVTGFLVHVSTLGAATAPEQDATITVSWVVGEDCFADLKMSRTDWGDLWDDPGAWLSYGCAADGQTIDVAGTPVFQRVPRHVPVSLAYEDLGTEMVVTIPLGAFLQGASGDVYGPNAKLEHISARSTVMVNMPSGTELVGAPYAVDETGCGLVQTGSACPEPVPYVIGS